MRGHLTDLETSNRLGAVGVQQPSKFYHVFNQPCVDGKPPIKTRKEIDELLRVSTEVEFIPAYLLTELLEMVEGDWELDYDTGYYCLRYNSGNNYTAATKIIIQAVAEVIIWQRGQ